MLHAGRTEDVTDVYNKQAHQCAMSTFKARLHALQHGQPGPVTGAGGSHTTSAATSQYSDSAASTPKRKFMDMRLQDAPIDASKKPEQLIIESSSIAVSSLPGPHAMPGEIQTAVQPYSGSAYADGRGQDLCREQRVPAQINFISPELRKSCALIDLAVCCESDSARQPGLPVVDEGSEPAIEQLLLSGSPEGHGTGMRPAPEDGSARSSSAMDTCSASESQDTGDENEAPPSGLTIPESQLHGPYGSVESAPCSDEVEPESSYESPRSLLPTPGVKMLPPLSAEQLAVLREGSARITRSIEQAGAATDLHACSPHACAAWADDAAEQLWDESPCLRPLDSAPAAADHGSTGQKASRTVLAETMAEDGFAEVDDDAAFRTGDSNSWRSHARGSGTDATSDGTCSGTASSACTECSSPGVRITSQENCCPNAGVGTDDVEVIPDTPTSSEEEEDEAGPAPQPAGAVQTLPACTSTASPDCEASAMVCADGNVPGTVCPVVEQNVAQVERRGRNETSTSLTSDELNSWKVQHCSSQLVQVRP